MKSSYTEVTVKLQDIIIEDMNALNIHSTVKALIKNSIKLIRR